MEPIRLLKPPDYTAEEREALIDFVLALRKSHIRNLLKWVDLPVSGTKPELRSRLQEALTEGQFTYERLVDFLDSVAPWGKQHVFLYDGPRFDLRRWRDPGHVQGLLKEHRLGKLFNARLPLILPDKLYIVCHMILWRTLYSLHLLMNPLNNCMLNPSIRGMDLLHLLHMHILILHIRRLQVLPYKFRDLYI